MASTAYHAKQYRNMHRCWRCCDIGPVVIERCLPCSPNHYSCYSIQLLLLSAYIYPRGQFVVSACLNLSSLRWTVSLGCLQCCLIYHPLKCKVGRIFGLNEAAKRACAGAQMSNKRAATHFKICRSSFTHLSTRAGNAYPQAAATATAPIV